MVNKRDNINTLVSGVHSLMIYIDLYIGKKLISSVPFSPIFCGTGRLPDELIPFSPMENAFPNSFINS